MHFYGVQFKYFTAEATLLWSCPESLAFDPGRPSLMECLWSYNPTPVLVCDMQNLHVSSYLVVKELLNADFIVILQVFRPGIISWIETKLIYRVINQVPIALSYKGTPDLLIFMGTNPVASPRR